MKIRTKYRRAFVLSGTLGVTGNTSLSNFSATGAGTVAGTLGVTGDTSLTTLTTSGLATMESRRLPRPFHIKLHVNTREAPTTCARRQFSLCSHTRGTGKSSGG